MKEQRTGKFRAGNMNFGGVNDFKYPGTIIDNTNSETTENVQKIIDTENVSYYSVNKLPNLDYYRAISKRGYIEQSYGQ